MDVHSHEKFKVKPSSKPRPHRSRSINPELVEPLVVADKGVSALVNTLHIKKLRLERHTWLDDMNCKDQEGRQIDKSVESLAIVACKTCVVITQCFNRDRASGAPLPGIVAGLNYDQRVMMYKRLDDMAVPINYDFDIPERYPVSSTLLNNDNVIG